VSQLLARVSEANSQGVCKCVSCGKLIYWNECDGGHYIAKGKGGSNSWALDMRNIHPQCKGCNGFQMRYGNAEARYTFWMIRKYGVDLVEMMTFSNPVVKWYAFELEQLIKDRKIEIKKHKKRIGAK